MTYSGGKPHVVGDRGQRYEVRATGWPRTEKSAIGWTDLISKAAQMAASARTNPSCISTEIFDRQDITSVITRYSGVLR